MYRTAAILLGLGLGGLVDAIVLHQLLQWHEMLSSTVPPTTVDALRTNIRWDGVLDALSWTLALAGVITLYRAARHRMPSLPPRRFAGFALIGWGMFNLVEGLLLHEMLGLHHVRPGVGYVAWDFSYLAIGGFAFVAVGALMTRPSGDWLVRGGRGGRRITPG